MSNCSRAGDPRRRRGARRSARFGAALLMLAAAALAPACSDCGEPDVPPFAKLIQLVGVVEVRASDADWQAASEGQGVEISHSVRTGPSGGATLVFRDGGRLRLLSGAELDLAAMQGGMVLKLGSGQMEVEAEGPGFRLVIGEGEEPVVIRGGKMSVSIEGDEIQLKMVLGEGAIEQGGETTSIIEGEGLTLSLGEGEVVGAPDAGAEDAAGLTDADSDASAGEDVADAGAGEVDGGDGETDGDAGDTLDGLDGDVGPDAPPVGGVAELVDDRRSARIKLGGQGKYRRPEAKRTPLIPNTAIRARRDAVIEGPGATRFRLNRRSRSVWLGAVSTGGGTQGHLRLERGEVRVIVRRGDAPQRVTTKRAATTVTARGALANVQVLEKRRETRIAVRVGRADVAVGDKTYKVTAGQVLVVGDDGDVTGPTSAGGARVYAAAGKRTHIYYDRRPRSIGFKWDGGPATLEVSKSSSFSDPILSEPIDGTSFVLSSVPGRVYWRIKRGGKVGETGRISMSRDPSIGKSSAVKNVIRDTGRETRVYFQGGHPNLTFRWKKVDGAERYRMRIYTASNLDRPFFDRKSRKNAVTLPAGKLKEGTYFWYQAALDGAGKELSTGQMNKLSLSFDNKLPTLRIDRASGGRVSGVAARGQSITVNGKPLSVSGDGRFSMSVRPEHGRYIFRIRRGGSDLYYVRRAR